MNTLTSCWKFGESVPGEATRAWWLVALPGREEWLCSSKCAFLSYPWKLTGQRAAPRPVKLLEHIADPETFGAVLENTMTTTD